MTDPKAAAASDEVVGNAKPAGKSKTSAVPDQQIFRSDECRVQDALEDDEVRQVLRIRHQRKR